MPVLPFEKNIYKIGSKCECDFRKSFLFRRAYGLSNFQIML